VDPIPGASAALVAAVGSGFPLNSVTFLGFPPLKAKARAAWFEGLSTATGTSVFFEAPHRIAPTLTELRLKLGTRQICVARELTKAHQEFVVGRADDKMFLSITRKGEFAIVVAAPDVVREPQAPVTDAAIVEAYLAFDRSGAGPGKRAVAAEIARRLGLTPNEVYRAVERAKV
jgi:16S rRNA (cytidine1402-2'-O)-methyltransferase